MPLDDYGSATGEYACPVCLFVGLVVRPYETWPPPAGAKLSPPYEGLLGRPSYEVCPRCGFEFGNDDNPGTAGPESFESYRAQWIAEGRPWFDQREAASHRQHQTQQVRAILRHAIGQATFDGVHALRRQVDHVVATEGPVTMLKLHVPDGTEQAAVPDGPIPVDVVVNDDAGEAVGIVLVWVTDGRLDLFEYGWFTDDPPDRLPRIEHLQVGRR